MNQNKKPEVYINEDDVNAKVHELAEKLNKDYEGKKLHIICILKGSVFFACALAKQLEMPVTMDFMVVSSYGSGTVSGKLEVKKDLQESIEGRDCLIVEDIIDSGNTLFLLKNMLLKRNPASLRICTFLNKPARRESDVKVDYEGFEIPDKFVVGFGMDIAEEYRNLPYIGVIEE